MRPARLWFCGARQTCRGCATFRACLKLQGGVLCAPLFFCFCRAPGCLYFVLQFLFGEILCSQVQTISSPCRAFSSESPNSSRAMSPGSVRSFRSQYGHFFVNRSTEVIVLLGLASVGYFRSVGVSGSLLAGIVALPLGEIGASCRTPVSDWLTVYGPSDRFGAVEECL